jgi:ferredoxin
MADGGTGFIEALKARVGDTLDACTRCGKCVEACPMTDPAGLDKADAVAIVEGVLDLLDSGPGTADAARWAQVCTPAASASRPATTASTRASWSIWRASPA